MKTQVETIINPDGSERTVRPHDSKKFTLQELQSFVQGYLELVIMKPGNGRGKMYCNEEGKLNGMAYNAKATAKALAADGGDRIVGPVVIVTKEGL